MGDSGDRSSTLESRDGCLPGNTRSPAVRGFIAYVSSPLFDTHEALLRCARSVLLRRRSSVRRVRDDSKPDFDPPPDGALQNGLKSND